MFQKVWGNRKILGVIWVSPVVGEKFLSHSAEKFRGHSLNVLENIGYRKTLCILGVSQFSAENCLSHSAQIFCKGIRLFLRKLLASKRFYEWKGGGGRISFLRRNNMVSQCRKTSWAPLQSFRKIVVSGNITHNRGITFFSRKLFVSQCRKLSWESLQFFETFRVSKNFMHNMGYHVFLSKILCLTVPKILVGIPSMFQKNSGIEKIMHIRGVTIFRRKLSVSQCRKFLWRSPTVFEKVFGPENCLRMKRGAYHILLSKFFDLLVPKIFVSISAMCQKNCGNGKTYAY